MSQLTSTHAAHKSKGKESIFSYRSNNMQAAVTHISTIELMTKPSKRVRVFK